MAYGYIYFRDRIDWRKRSVYKMGRSENCIEREYTYVTGEFIPGEMIYIVEVDKSIHVQLEKDLQKYFKNYHEYRGGGTEFYKTCVVDLVEPYLKNNNIVYRILNKNELQNIKKEVERKNKSSINEQIQNDEVTINNIDTLISQPKEHQKEALQTLFDHFNNVSEENKGVIVLPPGYGKSYIASFLIRQNRYKKVLILVPSTKICQDFRDAVINSGLKCTAPKKMVSHILAGITVTTYQAFSNNQESKNYFKSNNFDLIVYDEAHHLAADNSWNNSLDIPTKHKLFLTATPRVYKYEKKADHTYEPREYCMYNKVKYGPIIYSETIEQSINKGLLCNYKIYIPDHTRDIVGLCQDLINNYNRRRIIILYNSIANSKKAAAILKKSGFYAVDIEAKTKEDDRQKIYKEFKKFDTIPKIICNMNVIGEGANLPPTDTVIFAEKRESHISVIQNVGRALRVYPQKEYAIIVTPPDMNEINMIIKIIAREDNNVFDRTKYISSSIKAADEIYEKHIKIIASTMRMKLTAHEFIERLKSENIWNSFSYNNAFGPCFYEPYYEKPEEKYFGFSWHALNRDKYSFEEAREQIKKLINDHLPKLQNQYTAVDKYKYLIELDNKLPMDPFEHYEIKKYNELHDTLVNKD